MATSWLPGASPGPTSRSMASGQVSPSHSHEVFIITVFIPISHPSGDWSLRGYWEGLRTGGMLGGY